MAETTQQVVDRLNKLVTDDVKVFNNAMEEAAKKVPSGSLTGFQIQIAFEILVGVVSKTPVDTGTARGGWVVGVGRPSRSKGRPNKAGNEPITVGLTKMLSVKKRPFDTIWISNNINYILFLEDGHSQRQAPQGMVRVTLAEIATSLMGGNS